MTEPRRNKLNDKAAENRFRECIAEKRPHLRVGKGRQDGTEVTVIGTLAELHGPDGLCTCCHGRNNPSAKETA